MFILCEVSGYASVVDLEVVTSSKLGRQCRTKKVIMLTSTLILFKNLTKS